MVAKARTSYEAGDLRWVAEVLAHVLFAEPGHPEARTLQADTFERLGHGSESGPWRNFYLMGAAELRDGILGTPTPQAPDVLAALTAEQIFQSMAVRVDGPRAAGAGRLLLRWEFTDTGEVWTLLLSNGALTPMLGDAPRGERPAVVLRLARTTLNRVLGGATTFADEIMSGAVVLDGDAHTLITFGSLLESPDPDFAIVTPPGPSPRRPSLTSPPAGQTPTAESSAHQPTASAAPFGVTPRPSAGTGRAECATAA
ncbi:alkyl sulfatase C-terminal domain-containing protein [Streptomyces sp. NPDC048420]|uniref:alkyl sulfatase C-terminal domain-containing protein n=1 Tax=Streptomyces sp. NPDC048420 TaxID=3155755 RepID=UPI00341932A0